MKLARIGTVCVTLLLGLLVLVAVLLWPSLGGPDTGVQAEGCWEAQITEQWTDVDLIGSVLRVSVQGKSRLPVTIRSLGAFETVAATGTKPEYGPFVAEFAPLSKGMYFIEPQGLGLSYEIWLDGKNYTRVDFRPVSCNPTATATATPTPTGTQRPIQPPTATATPVPAAILPTATPTLKPATPLPPATVPPTSIPPAPRWQARVAEYLPQLEGSYFGTIAVRVIGQPAGQEVTIQANGFQASAKTGTKPEHGPGACEFGGLNSGVYRIAPTGLDTHLDVNVELGDFWLIEFYHTGNGETTTRWVGAVEENTSGNSPTEHSNSAIAVVVSGKPWHEVEIATDGWKTTAQTGTKPDYGPDACEFGGLRAATYRITPKGLGTSAEVTMDGWGWALVRFNPITVPVVPTPTAQPTQATSIQPTATPAPTGAVPPSPTPSGPRWKYWEVRNTSGQQPGTGIWSVIIVRVLDRAGVTVHIDGGGGWSNTCLTGDKPEYGPDACEFGGLWPGTYYVRPEGADIIATVDVDGLGTAEIHFAAP